MKKLILTLGLIAGLNSLYAEDGTVKITPSKELKLRKELKAYIEKLIEDFNTADPIKYKSYYHIPQNCIMTNCIIIILYL